jgi:hypothetical protein
MALYSNLPVGVRKTLNHIAEFSTKGKNHLKKGLDDLYTDVKAWVTAQAYLANVSEDTTPQLGGNLDVLGFNIQSSTGQVQLLGNSTDNVAIVAFDGDVTMGTAGSGDTLITSLAGTGDLKLNGLTWPAADGTINYFLQTNGAGVLSWAAGAGGLTDIVDDITPQLGGDLDVNGNDLVSTSNANINLLPHGTGNVALGNFVFNADQTIGAGQDNYVVTYDDATGLLNLEAATGGGLSDVVDDTTPQLGGNLDVNGNSIVSVSGGDIAITPDTTGDVILDGLKWPQADGSANQVIETDGLGQLSWVANAGSGIANVVDDTTPQLGGSLDVNGQKIVSVTNGNIDIEPHGTGNVLLGNYTFDADQTVGAGQDNYVLTYDNGTGLISLEASAGGGGTWLGLSDTPGSFSANQWVKVNAGATALELTSSPVTSVSATAPVQKSGTTSVTVSMPAAAGPSTDGYMTGSDKDKLDNIEANADVTDATNVAAATAVMDADFGSNGMCARTASGTYANRTITGGNEITVTNGDGVSGAPDIAFDRTITASTSAPSGGSDGDIWFRYV